MAHTDNNRLAIGGASDEGNNTLRTIRTIPTQAHALPILITFWRFIGVAGIFSGD